jgi:hypothetical protein
MMWGVSGVFGSYVVFLAGSSIVGGMEGNQENIDRIVQLRGMPSFHDVS